MMSITIGQPTTTERPTINGRSATNGRQTAFGQSTSTPGALTPTSSEQDNNKTILCINKLSWMIGILSIAFF
ncbi:hypothetical protein DPMN_100942 [Dreissena polymorpha]|uniref:Uncharacterized protein n=1 Tax=Dreissena polymorpha TaxID=45954 RepID=A0A9D4LI70_DREPO|nr:hypothetical protein DPMN_100942 [Dreissena polymorpha]